MPIKQKIALWVNKSLRIKITIGVLFPLLVVFAVFLWVEQTRHRQAVLDSLSLLASQSGRVIESSLRHSMMKSDFSEMQTILDSINSKNDFRLVYLMDTHGKVIFAPKGEGTGIQLNNQTPDCQPCHQLAPSDRPSSVVVKAGAGEDVFRSMYPILNSAECATCHDPQNRLIGLLLIDIPVSPVEALVESHLWENLIWWAGMIAATVLIVNVALSRIVIRRLEDLAHALRNFGLGRLDFRLPVGDQDEIGQLASSYNEMGQQLQSETTQIVILSEDLRRQSDLRGELVKQLITAQEDERKRVARELHDDLGQALSALLFQIDLLDKVFTPENKEAAGYLAAIRGQITDAIERMYDLILALRPSALDDLGLEAALRAHAIRYLDGSGIAFQMNSEGMSERLPPDIETALYRIFQEALTNIRRHSAAANVTINLKRDSENFVGEINDDGRGFDPQAISRAGDKVQGLGLLSMEERVARLGGQLEIISQPGAGVLVRIIMPIEEKHD